MNALRRLVLPVAAALGLIAATATSASAGMVLNNHCPPSALRSSAREERAVVKHPRLIRLAVLATMLTALTGAAGAQASSTAGSCVPCTGPATQGTLDARPKPHIPDMFVARSLAEG